MLEDIQAAIPLGFFLSFMIGPVFFVLLETSVLKGFRAAIVFDLGVILADILFLIIAYFSSRQLLENLSNKPGLYILGGVILVVYGISIFIKKELNKTNTPEDKAANSSKGYLGLFIKGFLLNFINIGVLAFWLVAIITAGASLDNNPKRIFTFFSAMIFAYFATDVIKILLAKRLKRKLTTDRIRLIKKGIGIILVISGVVFITKGFLPKDKFNIEQGIEKIEQIRE